MRGPEKYAFWGKDTTATFQLKIMLDTDDLVSVYSEKVLINTKRGKFEDFLCPTKLTTFGEFLSPKFPNHYEIVLLPFQNNLSS